MSNLNQSLSDDEKAALSNLEAALKPFYIALEELANPLNSRGG
jgi:hypothetical protein